MRLFLTNNSNGKLAGRHLGATQMYSSSNAQEVVNRGKAMWKSYRHMGRFWQGCQNFKMKALVFQANVICTSFSGLETCVLSRAEHDRLTNATITIGRKALGRQSKKQNLQVREWTSTKFGRAFPMMESDKNFVSYHITQQWCSGGFSTTKG